jgi:hypothetical protein
VEIEGLGGEVSFREKVLWVFVSPSRCFDALRENPDWFKAWVLVAVLGMLPGLVFLSTVDVRRIAEDAVDQADAERAESQEDYQPLSAEERGESGEDYQPLSAEEREQAVERLVKYQWSVSTVGSVVFSLFRLLLTVAAIHVLALMMGIGGSFGGALSVWAYSSIVRIPEMLIGSVVVGVTKGEGSGLGFLFGGGTVSPVMRLVIGQFDPFSLWQLAVAALGLSLIRRASRARALAVMVALWVLWWGLGIWGLMGTAPPGVSG